MERRFSIIFWVKGSVSDIIQDLFYILFVIRYHTIGALSP